MICPLPLCAFQARVMSCTRCGKAPHMPLLHPRVENAQGEGGSVTWGQPHLGTARLTSLLTQLGPVFAAFPQLVQQYSYRGCHMPFQQSLARARGCLGTKQETHRAEHSRTEGCSGLVGIGQPSAAGRFRLASTGQSSVVNPMHAHASCAHGCTNAWARARTSASLRSHWMCMQMLSCP